MFPMGVANGQIRRGIFQLGIYKGCRCSMELFTELIAVSQVKQTKSAEADLRNLCL
jgi:hypothetical protein